MNLPDRVNLDLRQHERDNDDAEEYFAMNRDAMIEEEVYRLEKKFDLDDFTSAIDAAPASLEVELFSMFRARSGSGCLSALEDIRDAWIKRKAEEKVENDE